MFKKTVAIQKLILGTAAERNNSKGQILKFVLPIFAILMIIDVFIKELIFGSGFGPVLMYGFLFLFLFLFNSLYNKTGLLFRIPLKKTTIVYNSFICINLIYLTMLFAVVLLLSAIMIYENIATFIKELGKLATFDFDFNIIQHCLISTFIAMTISNIFMTIFFVRNKIVSLILLIVASSGFIISIYFFNVFVKSYSKKPYYYFASFLKEIPYAWGIVGVAFLLAVATAVIGVVISTRLFKGARRSASRTPLKRGRPA